MLATSSALKIVYSMAKKNSPNEHFSDLKLAQGSTAQLAVHDDHEHSDCLCMAIMNTVTVFRC